MSDLLSRVQHDPSMLSDDLVLLDDPTARGSADLLFRGAAGRLHLVYVSDDPTPELVREIGARVRDLRAAGELATGWLVSASLDQDLDELAVEQRVMTRDLAEPLAPSPAPTPSTDRPQLRGRHGLRATEAEHVALSELSPEVRALLSNLQERGYEIRHGGQMTHLIYRGQGLGGIDRDNAHGYVSKLLVTEALGSELRALGFAPGRQMTGAFSGHRWLEIDLVRGAQQFARALPAVERVVDAELGPA